MTRSLKKAVIAATLLSLFVCTISPNIYSQGRLERAPARDVEGTQPIPAGSQTIPAGTIIILEIDDQLSSASSRRSDRFRAHVASPITDTTGKLIVPVGTVVECHVSTVEKAKWRHRSGTLSVEFDNIRKLDGTPTPVKATLTSAKAEDRKRLNDEYSLKADSTLARDIIFVGGGAGAGAAIGVFTGGALLGAGIGAAAGLTAVLLMKGKDVVVEQGERFGMELIQPIPARGFVFEPRPPPPQFPTQTPLPDNRQLPGSLNPYDATVSREQDGSVKVRMNAEAPSQGWRVFSNHDNPVNGVARIRLRGTPPASSGFNAQLRQLTATPVPEICLDDPGRVIRRIEFMDKFGRLSFPVDVPSQPGSRYMRAPIAPVNPGTGTITPNNPPVITQPGTQPQLPTGSVAGMAQSSAQKVDVIRRQYANDLGYMIDRNGQATFFGQQQPTVDQKLFFEGLMTLYSSLLKLQNGSPDAATIRTNAQKVQEDANFTNQAWRRIRLDPNLNNRWNIAYAEINSMLSVAYR
ncbi:MAG: hypothetical protein ACRD82_08765 [Blastocatellia bacterium]